MKFDKADADFLKEHGITPEQASRQLDVISAGFQYLELECPATVDRGIAVATDKIQEEAIGIWHKFISSGGTVMKFTPASGAASRMFKNVHAFNNSDESKPHDEFMKKFFSEIHDFAFFRRLNLLTTRYYQKNIDNLMKEGRYKDITTAMLEHEGLGYATLPKALLMFHKVMGSTRTALEEHMAEGAQYAAMQNGKAHLHFTVSPEHLSLAQMKVEEVKSFMGKEYGVEYEIDFSIQKPSTDTIAADMDGKPFRDDKGNIVLRPGGHGALIENLNELDAYVIFIKNIDNVVPDSKRGLSNYYKEILGGIAVGAKRKTDSYMETLEKGTSSDENIIEMLGFLRRVLNISGVDTAPMSREEKIEFLRRKLNRPLRVCAMVKNEGEPGGGPWLVKNPDGTSSPQILESTQIDPNSKAAMEMLSRSTHFNPVDLVVCTRDWKGNKFDLRKYVDEKTGFISTKSKDGRELKALELPGLWNGAMSDWNTIFVEVPAETFNPVKTVNDLLRKVHQVS